MNASVPKTLVQYLIRWLAEKGELGSEAKRVLRDVLATAISPELVPGETEDEPGQHSEHVIGPYDLQDFQPVLPAPVRVLADEGGFPCMVRMARQDEWRLARRA